MKEKTVQEAVDNNYAAFKKLLPELLNLHPGKFVINARREGHPGFRFGWRCANLCGGAVPRWSVLNPTGYATVMDMGYFSHAVHHAEL